MNRYILVAAITVVLLGVGGYFFINSQKGITMPWQGNNMMNSGEKPITKPGGSYQLEVTSDTTNINPKTATKFSFRVKDTSGEVFKKYEIAHEKLMHFIGVRKDLANFLHLHPDYNEATGEFTVMIPFPDDGPYRLFPDFTPGVENPDKQPVTLFTDVEVGNSANYYVQSVVPDSEVKKTYGEYNISFDFPKDVQKEKEVTFGVSVAQNGQPVTNLENYLGALGHSVILKEGTLDFIHTHALDSKSTDTTQAHDQQQAQHGSTTQGTDQGPKISFSTTFPESGVYKIFTQFQHKGKVQTVDYIVKVN